MVWLPSLGGGFLYDDHRIIVENRSIRDLRLLRAVLEADPTRPLLGLSWALNYKFAGLSPGPYHAVNVVLHAVNAVLAAALGAWTARARPDRVRVALWTGLFFAVTPMASEAVAYLASRSSLLAGAFSLAAVRVGVSSLERRSRRGLAATLGLLALGLAAKEEAAAVPLLILLLDLVFLAEGRLRSLRDRTAFHLPLLALPALGLVARRALFGAWLPPSSIDRGDYLLTQAAAFPGYLARALVPLDPAFYRGAPLHSWPPSLTVGALAGVALLLLASAAATLRRRPRWSLAVGWMALSLLPSSSLVPLREMVVDHRAYVGNVGVAVLAGSWLAAPAHLPFAVGAGLLLAARAVHYQWVMGDPQRAWTDALRRAPDTTDALFGLAEALAEKHDPRAEAFYRRATQTAPHDARTWSNLGRFLALQERWPEAQEALRRAVDGDPADARLRLNLGLILAAQGKTEEAVAELEAARGLRPALARVRIDLAALVAARGETGRARALLDEAARIGYGPEDGAMADALRARLP